MNGNRKIAVKWTALILALCLTGASRAQTADAPIDKAYHDFARKIERAVSQGNGQLMDAAFDLDILMERMLGGRGISAKTISGIKQGVRQSLDLGRQLNRIVANGGSYKLLKLHRQGNELRALYRLQAEDGLNYHDAVLVKKNGRVRIADIYVFISGEYLSATMRRFALPVITRQEKSPLMKLLTKESEFVKSFPRVMSMTNAVRAGKPVEALGIYDKLPASVQRDKSVMLLRFKAATLKGPGSLESRPRPPRPAQGVSEGVQGDQRDREGHRRYGIYELPSRQRLLPAEEARPSQGRAGTIGQAGAFPPPGPLEPHHPGARSEGLVGGFPTAYRRRKRLGCPTG